MMKIFHDFRAQLLLVCPVMCAGIRSTKFRGDVVPDEGVGGSPGLQRWVLCCELQQQWRLLHQPQSLAGWRQQHPATGLHHSCGPGHQQSYYTGTNSTEYVPDFDLKLALKFCVAVNKHSTNRQGLLAGITSLEDFECFIATLLPFMFVFLTPAGDRHQSRPVSCDRPDPWGGLWLAGRRHTIGFLGGHQHSGPVCVAPPAESQRCCHLIVLPRAPSTHVSVAEH